jgi:hypothetical protein
MSVAASSGAENAEQDIAAVLVAKLPADVRRYLWETFVHPDLVRAEMQAWIACDDAASLRLDKLGGLVSLVRAAPPSALAALERGNREFRIARSMNAVRPYFLLIPDYAESLVATWIMCTHH